MNYQNKTREELLEKIQKLQQENDTLKLGHQESMKSYYLNEQSQNHFINKFWKAKDYFELIINTNPDATLISRLNDGVIVNLNAGFTKLTGFSPNDIIGKSSIDLHLWKKPSERQKMVDRLTEKGTIDNFEATFLKKDGSSMIGLMSAKVILLKNVPHIISLTRDITEHKKTEAALKLSEKKYRLIADNVSDVIWQMDAKTHKFTYISPSVERLTGYKAEEVLRHPFEWLLTPKSQKLLKRVVPILQTSYKHGEYETFVYELEHPCIDGSTVWTETTTRFITDEETGRLMVFGSARNIMMRKKAEEEITLKNEELQKLNAQKDKFFSIIAHDLKSPFNAVVGFSELLLEGAKAQDYDGIQKYAEIILQSSERAMNLLVNLMEWARSQTGRMDFNPENIELTDLITQIALLFYDVAGQKSIKIKKILPPNATVYGDKAMISTVIRNLISNAIKFSMPGSEITISVCKNQEEVIIIVGDKGVGIPKDRIEKLFQIDENYSTEGTNHEQGTGLGLVLCKEFVEKHGGQIRVKSEVGQGSDFIFSIPSHKTILV